MNSYESIVTENGAPMVFGTVDGADHHPIRMLGSGFYVGQSVNGRHMEIKRIYEVKSALSVDELRRFWSARFTNR